MFRNAVLGLVGIGLMASLCPDSVEAQWGHTVYKERRGPLVWRRVYRDSSGSGMPLMAAFNSFDTYITGTRPPATTTTAGGSAGGNQPVQPESAKLESADLAADLEVQRRLEVLRQSHDMKMERLYLILGYPPAGPAKGAHAPLGPESAPIQGPVKPESKPVQAPENVPVQAPENVPVQAPVKKPEAAPIQAPSKMGKLKKPSLPGHGHDTVQPETAGLDPDQEKQIENYESLRDLIAKIERRLEGVEASLKDDSRRSEAERANGKKENATSEKPMERTTERSAPERRDATPENASERKDPPPPPRSESSQERKP